MNEPIRSEPGRILSKSVAYNGVLYCQGVTASNLSGDISAQTAEVLDRIDQILQQSGSDKSRLLQVQIWLKDIRDRDAMNEVWSAWLPEGRAPVRACVQANMANPRHLIEIMVVAHI